MATISTVCLKGGILRENCARRRTTFAPTSDLLFLSWWVKQRKSEERDTNKRAACSFWPRPRAHISKERATPRHFLLPFTRLVKGVWNLSIAFLQIVNFAAGSCTLYTSDKKISSIVNIISLWKSHAFYIKPRAGPLDVLLLSRNKKWRDSVSKCTPIKSQAAIKYEFFLWVFFFFFAAACINEMN